MYNTATAERLVLDEPDKHDFAPSLIDPTMLLSPEKRLMLAVLEGAVRDFQTYAMVSTGRGRQIFVDADRWFHARPMGPFAFENICHAVGLDPDFIRDGLRRWRAAQRFQPTVIPLSARLAPPVDPHVPPVARLASGRTHDESSVYSR